MEQRMASSDENLEMPSEEDEYELSVHEEEKSPGTRQANQFWDVCLVHVAPL